MGPRLAAACAALCLILSNAAPAADGSRRGGGPNATGLPVPRFVSLRSNEVNLRTGPNTRYPIEWVFVRKDMPVEITAEFDTWRRIRDWQGSEGWVHQSMLSGKRSIVVTGETRTLRREPGAEARPVALVKPGVFGWLLKCKEAWCQVDVKGTRGWLRRSDVWGVKEDETVE